MTANLNKMCAHILVSINFTLLLLQLEWNLVLVNEITLIYTEKAMKLLLMEVFN